MSMKRGEDEPVTIAKMLSNTQREALLLFAKDGLPHMQPLLDWGPKRFSLVTLQNLVGRGLLAKEIYNRKPWWTITPLGCEVAELLLEVTR